MIWFWVWWLLLAVDAGCWAIAMRLTRLRVWRILLTVFMAGQILVLLSLLCEFVDVRLYPQPVLAAVAIWHRIALPIVLVVLLLWTMATRKWAARLMSRWKRKCPSPTSMTCGALRSRREFIGTVAAAAPCLFTVGATGIALAQIRQFRVRRFALSIPTLPRELDGTTIAHVTDMHVGRWTCGRVLREMVNTTNALRPDLVLLTGDLIDYDLADLSEAIATVKNMQGRYGQWMIEGNHDLFDDGAEFERRVKAAGVPLLMDQSAVANVRGHPIQFFGLRWMGFGRGHADDLERDRQTASQMRLMMKHRQPDAFPILLAHHPHAFDAAAKEGLPLTLAGHTHGGQWMLNKECGVGPILFRYWSGLYTRGGSQMIVSNGAGNVFPIRVNAPAEIVHITLRAGDRNRVT